MPYETYSTRQMQRLVGDVVNELSIDDGRPLHHDPYIQQHQQQQLQQQQYQQQQQQYQQYQQQHQQQHQYGQYGREREPDQRQQQRYGQDRNNNSSNHQNHHHHHHQHSNHSNHHNNNNNNSHHRHQQTSSHHQHQQQIRNVNSHEEEGDYASFEDQDPYEQPHDDNDNYHHHRHHNSDQQYQNHHSQPAAAATARRAAETNIFRAPAPAAAPTHQQQQQQPQQPNASTTSYSHPARCPPLNLEFMWKLYHQRTMINNNRLQETRDERIATLNSQGFPTGLAELILEHSMTHPIRIWLVDNCGTMHKSDGHMVSQSSKGKVNVIHCTRWEEITSTVLWHAEMAAWQQTPMALRLLQDPGTQVGPQQLGISASKHYSSTEEVSRMKALLQKTRPVGLTSPISMHVQELFPCISSMVSMMNRMEQKLTLCICTDSIPTDEYGNEEPHMMEEFLTTLQQLVAWPVQVVLRLSTDEERVVQFYRNILRETYPQQQQQTQTQTQQNQQQQDNRDNNGHNRNNNEEDNNNNNNTRGGVGGGGRNNNNNNNRDRGRDHGYTNDNNNHDGDNNLYGSNNTTASYFSERIVVLDDYVSECQHVQENNPWLNYGYPMHLCREEGIRVPVLDALSERPLVETELSLIVNMIFGGGPDNKVCCAVQDYAQFRKDVVALNKETGVLWNPIKKKFVPWIDIKKLDRQVERIKFGKNNNSNGNNNNNNNGEKCVIS